jgi:ribosomal protein L37AE/L43A
MIKELKTLLQKYFGISSPKPTATKKDITEKRIKRLSIKTEIVNGHCPVCEKPTMFISIALPIYRCMHCGYDLEQRINGAIHYIPISSSGSEHRIVLDDGSK